MRVSSLMRQLPPSPIRKLSPLADKAKWNGIDVIHLNIGQPDIVTPSVFHAAMRDALAQTKIVGYMDSAGYAPLREAMAAYFISLGFPYSSSDILVTYGGSEALQIALMTCLDPGSEVLVPEPLYPNYVTFALPFQIRIVPIPTAQSEDFALPPRSAIEALITDKTGAILVSNPGNPTGAVLSPAEIGMLAEIAKERQLFILADELYRELIYDGREPTSFAPLTDMAEHIVFIDSVSKRYSGCGLRIGCLATKNSAVLAGALKYCQGRLAATSLEMIAATALYKLDAAYFAPLRAVYQARRDVLVDGLNAIPGVSCFRPGGAFYTICTLPVRDTERFAAWLLSDFALNGRTLMVAPAPAFYVTPGRGQQEVRIAYVRDIPDLHDACTILEEALRHYPDN